MAERFRSAVCGDVHLQRWQADKLVEAFRRHCRLVSAGLVNEADLTGRLWELLSFERQVSPAVVRRMWEFVPVGAREGFAATLRQATSPQFRLLPWIREGLPMTLEEAEQDAELRSSRVRAWAAAFCWFLDAVENGLGRTSRST